MERRVSSLEDIESVHPPSASSHRRNSVTSEEDDDKRVIRRARARSLDTTQHTATHRYMTHKGSIKANFSIWTPDSKLFVWIRRKLIKIGRVHEDYSLFLFHKKGRFRRTVKRIVKAKPFLLFMALIVILNAIALCFYQPSIRNDLKNQNSLIAYITLVATLLYTVEAGLKIIAFGLILHPKAYLRRVFHILDVLIILFGILYASINTTLIHIDAEVLGSFMALKLLRILAVFESVRLILKALASSVAPLFYLSIMTLSVMVFFALIGMELFLGVLHGGCYSNFTSPTGSVNMSLVSNYPCAWNTSILGVATGSHDCPAGSTCRYWDEGPNNGMTSFDSFPQAFLTVFQLITLEGWSEVFYLYESAVGYTYAWVYFISVIVLGSVFILNLWTGVLTSVFIGVSDRQEEHGNIRKLKETSRINEDIKNYKDWMKKAAELELPSETGSTEKRPPLFFGRTWISPVYGNYDSEDDGLETDEEQFTEEAGEERELRRDFKGCLKYFVHKSRRAVRVLLKSLVFFWFSLGILAINLILLMALHYPAPNWFTALVATVNYIFAIIYVLLTLLLLYGVGPRVFFSSSRRILTFTLAMVNLLDLLVLVHIPQVHNVVNITMVVNSCRCVGLIQIFRYTRYWKAMSQIMNTVFQLLSLILSLVAILGIFLFVFTIIGMRLYGGRLSLKENVEPNFDTWFSSFLLVFQLMTTEDWHNVMYASVDFEERLFIRYIETIYFLVAVWMGGFVLVSIFLAIVVDKLSEVRSVEEDSAKQNAKRKEERKAREEHINALKVDEPQVRRTTIRRAMKYLSDNPALRARAVQEPERKLWQQTSLPADKVKRTSLFNPTSDKQFKTIRTMSVPLIKTPVRLREEPGMQSGDTGQTVHSRRQRNPLRLIRPTSGYFEMRREGGSASIPPHAKSTTRENTATVSTNQESSAASVFVFPPSFDHKKEVLHSTTPTPVSADVVSSSKAPQERNLSYERTQSLPAGTPSSCDSQRLTSSTEDGAQELEVIIEGTSEAEEEKEEERLQRQESLEEIPKLLSQDYQGSSHIRSPPLPSPPVPVVSDDVHSRLAKESSLEAVQQPCSSSLSLDRNEDQQVERRPSQMDTTKSQLKDKARRLWEWLKEYSGTIQFNPADELKEIPNHSAFFILSPDNRFRQFCFRLISSTVFLTITSVAIFLSSVILTLEIPVREANIDSFLCTIQNVIVYLDLVVVIFFLIEMALKVTALGVILHRGSYLRGFFNFIDFIVTVTSLIPILEFFTRGELESSGSCLSYSYQLMSVALNILRVLRVLRPLRAIRASGLYLVVRGLLSSLKSIGSILFYDLLIITVFAVIGTQIFKGRFRYCTDPMVRTVEECRGMYFTYPNRDLTCPVVANRTWMNKGLNFDNYGTAFLTLYVMLTFEGWQDVMYSGINASLQPNMGPDPDSPKPEAAIYFVLYMFLMPFVLLNLFVGFVIVTFQKYGVKSFRKTKLDRNQRNCLYFALTARPYRRYYPSYKIHQKIHKFVNHAIFKIVIFIALVLNIILLALLRHQSVNVVEEVEFYYWFNVAFTIFFALEAILKIIALTPPNYFRKGWNTFEFLIALAAIVEIILQHSLSSMLIDKYQYSRIASTFRVLRLLRMVPKVRLILWTVVKSLEIFPWVGVLWLLVVFLYSVIGVQVFGDIAVASVDEGSQIMQYNNFANFPRALLVLFRVSTGENWQDVMLDCIDGHPCHEHAGGNRTSCGSGFSYFFFPSFFFLSSILILNLFVAIIIDNFDYLVRDRSKLGDHQLGLFIKLWSLYDPEAKGTLPPDKVMDLLRQCNPPVGWGKLCPHALACKKMMKLNMPLIDGQVTFNATLFALVRTSLKVPCEGCPNCAHVCNKKMLEKLKILFPRLPQKKLEEVLPEGDMHTVKKEYAAQLIQVQWRRFTLKRRKTIERFTGSGRRVLKAGLRRLPDVGPDLGTRRLSVLSLELPDAHQMPRRASGCSTDDTILGTERMGSPFNPLEMGADERAEDIELHPVGHSKSSFIRRLQTIEEQPDSSTVPTETRLEETDSNLNEADLQSELSYASAYSSPMQSLHSYQLEETTV